MPNSTTPIKQDIMFREMSVALQKMGRAMKRTVRKIDFKLVVKS